MKKYIIATLGIAAFMACSNTTNNTEQLADNHEQETVHEGAILLKKNCYVCHHPRKNSTTDAICKGALH